jgi:hypothetical protein
MVVLAVLVSCAPAVDGPVEKQRAFDRADADLLRTQLAALPGVHRAEVVLRRPVRDPLATAAPAPTTASLVLVVEDRADRARLEASARALARTFVEVEPTIVIDARVESADLAKVGPFTVDAKSKGPLKATLAAALTIIAALASWIAWARRPR